MHMAAQLMQMAFVSLGETNAKPFSGCDSQNEHVVIGAGAYGLEFSPSCGIQRSLSRVGWWCAVLTQSGQMNESLGPSISGPRFDQ